MSDIDMTLEQRGTRYGDFEQVAQLTESVFQTWLQAYYQIHGGAKAEPLPPYIVTALHMISNKVARGICGDPLFVENYRDIAGYSELVVRALKKNPRATDTQVVETI